MKKLFALLGLVAIPVLLHADFHQGGGAGSGGGGSGTVTSVGSGTGLSGGPITTSGSLSLANTAVTAASYGSQFVVPSFTVDAQGRLTAASANTAISTTALGAVPTARTLTAGTGLSGGGDLSANRTLTLANTAVTAASYGSQFVVPSFTVDQQGRLTAASSNTAISNATLGATPTTRTITAGTGLSGGGDLSADRTLNLANTAVTAGAYTSADITIDAQGRITAAANGSGGGGSSSGAAGSIQFSDGASGFDSNDTRLSWDDTTERLLIGNQPALTGDANGIVRAFNVVTDPSSSAVYGTYVGGLDGVFTTSSTVAIIAMALYPKVHVAAGESAGALVGSYMNLNRADSGDDGAVPLAAGYLASFDSGNSSTKNTALFASFMSAFSNIDSNANQITDMYDFYAQAASLSAGSVTNRYGIVIEPDSGYTKKNWLSGTTQIGGSSAHTLDAGTSLEVSGDIVSDVASLFFLRTNNKTGSDSSATTILASGSTVDGNSGGAVVLSGTPSGTGSSGNASMASSPSAVGSSGDVSMRTGDITDVGAGTNSGSAGLTTGNNAGTGNSGDAFVAIGTVASGTRGKFRILDGSEGTSGYVWTSTDTSGAGAWMPAGGGGGGANTTLSNLGTTAINASLLFDTPSTYNVGDPTNPAGTVYADVVEASQIGLGATSYIDFANSTLYDTANSVVMQFDSANRQLKDESQLLAMEFTTTDRTLNATDETTTVDFTTPGKLKISGDAVLTTAGNGLYVKEGSNATMGTCTLSVGTCTVSTTKVTSSSRIFLTAQSLGTVSVGQGLAVSARSAGTSFTVLSGSAIDTSTVAWMIVEPAP